MRIRIVEKQPRKTHGITDALSPKRAVGEMPAFSKPASADRMSSMSEENGLQYWSMYFRIGASHPSAMSTHPLPRLGQPSSRGSWLLCSTGDYLSVPGW